MSTIKPSTDSTTDADSKVDTPELPPEMLEIQKVLGSVDADKNEDTVETGTEESQAKNEGEVLGDDPKTDEAVAEIVAAEGDEVLEIEDAVRDAESEPVEPLGLKQKLKALWQKPMVRRGMIAGFVVGILSVVIVPQARYFFLNSVGVRASSSLAVYDASTQQPLKNVTVRIGSAQGMTGTDGTVRLEHIKLGSQKFVVEKRAFATTSKKLVVGWGSNPLGNLEIIPTGTQYDFAVTDFASTKGLQKVELTSGDASALTDEKGHAKLTIEKPGDQDLQVSVVLSGYRSDTVTLKPDTKSSVDVKLAPARKHLYISKRSGKFDLYSVYADGQQDKLVVAGSGSEREAGLALVPHPSDSPVAYVSTRGNQLNSDGYMLSNLILVDSDSGETTNVIASERVDVVGWSGSKLVYVLITAGQSARSPDRYRVMSYDYKTKDNKQLANANYFNDVAMFGGQVFYAPNGGLESAPVKFYRINPDGSNNQAVFDQEVWSIVRTGYQELALSVGQQWYQYTLGASQATKRSGPPSSQVTRTYIDSPDAKHSAWVDIRDGKGVLVVYDLGTKTEKVITELAGLTYPVQWLDDNTIVYRVTSPKVTADYVVSADGGSPIKLNDVTATKGLGSNPNR